MNKLLYELEKKQHNFPDMIVLRKMFDEVSCLLISDVEVWWVLDSSAS